MVVGADGPEEVGQESRRGPPTTEGVYSVGMVQQDCECFQMHVMSHTQET